ncbi:hypothetical protein KAR91_45525 [Candidatus Pacearchaeota archaeon]|nr:hypothetical protein [Candidatus Pacearchaeota archaeon]
MKWNWHNPEEYLPETPVGVDWGKQSVAILGDYGKNEEYRFCHIIYEIGETDIGESYSDWTNPDGEECAPPDRWTYIED